MTTVAIMQMTSMGVSAFMALAGGLSNMWVQTLNKAAQNCNHVLEPREKSKCMLNFKIAGKKKVISGLNAGKRVCKGNPKCIEKANKKIKAENEHLKMFTDQLRNLLQPQQLK